MRTRHFMVSFTFLTFVVGGHVPATAADAPLKITKIEPTVFFPKPEAGKPLCQVAHITVQNSGGPVEAEATITLAGQPPLVEPLGRVPPGTSIKTFHVPDIAQPKELTLELLVKAHSQPASGRTDWQSVLPATDRQSCRTGWQSVLRRKLVWRPQKKWKLYSVSYSHQDLGFGDYPHRLRTNIRHANIDLPLKFCRETDAWDNDSRFRFMIETSEPITSYLGTVGESRAAELARRIREGRLQIGALHNTASTEQLSQELLARLFYLSGRHCPDLLGVPRSRTVMLDDVIGITWPMATFCREAGVPYFFHGHNGCATCLQPAAAEPVFFWQAPDGDGRNKVLVRSTPYGGYAGDSLGDGSEAHIQKAIATFAAHWPYDALLLQNGTDFELVTMDNCRRIHAWNAKWAYPRLICATMDMFFDAIAAQADPRRIKTFAGDAPNQWVDQDATDARLLAQARRQDEAIPTAEKLATIAQVVAGGGYPWEDVYQAYHRLLQYHEHTDASDRLDATRAKAQQYETELEEDREMVDEARAFCDRAREGALKRLAAVITRQADRTLIVFNPLVGKRTDVVRVATKQLPGEFRLVDACTGKDVSWQRMPDGEIAFIAADVPSLGYKTFQILPSPLSRRGRGAGGEGTLREPSPPILENPFYRLAFDPTTGAITSLRDKQLGVELVDQTAPYRFNEYLYERYESPDVKQPSRWYRVQSARLQSVHGPVADCMLVRAKPMGVESLQQTVVLYRGLKRIDFRLDIVKSPSGRNAMVQDGFKNKESVYVALPLAVPKFTIRQELPGAVVEPIRQQFAGSCTAYYAVRHFTDLSNARYGVTVSAVDSSMMEYGRPRSCPICGPVMNEGMFEKTLVYPCTSRLYLYLLDNMFDCNIRLDQRGPMRFCWSLASHRGDWKAGKADEFGWDVHNPLIAKVVRGKPSQGNTTASPLPLDGRGAGGEGGLNHLSGRHVPSPPAPLPRRERGDNLPAGGASFVTIDKDNVACTTIKPAEANGSGLILRFVETRGTATTAAVSLPLFGRIASASETDLVENDRPVPVAVDAHGSLRLSLRPFGVKTIRVLWRPEGPPATIADLKASPVSDMEVALSWRIDPRCAERTGHYELYRGTRPDFEPNLLHLVARPATPACIDRPQLRYGGWINNRLEPHTTYYYRVAAVDRWNNRGPLSAPVPATTLKSSQKSMVPLGVVGLRAIHISPLAPHNYVNLLWRTNCESTVAAYHVCRSTQQAFTPSDSNRIGVLASDAVIKGEKGYGHTGVDRRVREFDHAMYQDFAVAPSTTYYYRVAAVNRAGRRGPYSREASVRTGPPRPIAEAQSVYAPQYGPENAIDGDLGFWRSWVSAPYGGGTKQHPRDVWLAVHFPRKIAIQGVKIVGDYRAMIPLQPKHRIEVRLNGKWQPMAIAENREKKPTIVTWDKPIATDGLRLYCPAAELPKSSDPAQDGIVRVVELYVVLPDGSEQGPLVLF